MKLRVLGHFQAIIVIALFSYSAASAQVVEKVKEAADKTKEVTVDITKKTVEKTKDATVNAAKTTGSGTKKIGNYTVELVDNVKGQSYEGGKWIIETTWNGTKWVSKRVWIATKKATDTTKETIIGDGNKQP